MPDILIHRCTLRVVRRGGWSWGPDPKRFLHEVMRSFPALLARKLQEFAFADDREVAAPIRVHIPIRLGDFMPELHPQSRIEPLSGSNGTAQLEERVEVALQAAFGVTPQKPSPEPLPERFPVSPSILQEKLPSALAAAGALPRLLLKWHAEGVLESRLACFSPHELEIWHGALWRKHSTADESLPQKEHTLPEQIETFIRSRAYNLDTVSPADRLRLRIVIAAQVACELHIALDHPLLRQVLDSFVPADVAPLTEVNVSRISNEVAEDLREDEKPHTPQPSVLAITTLERTSSKSAPPHPSAWESQIACALPFLMLGPLSRLGYFDLLAAVLEAAGLEEDAPLLAAALAYKVLAPPERGWRRDPQSYLAAAVLAGRRDPIAEEELVDFSRRMALHTGPLDRFLGDVVMQGHASGAPILLCRADVRDASGFLLVDFPGCFPIVFGDEIAALLPSLRRLDSPVLVSREAAGPQILRDLHAAGVTFLSDVPPIRNESWHRVQPGMGWTNHPQPESATILAAAHEMAPSSEEAAALWETIGVARPAAVGARLPQLDRSLTIAAAIAAGTISWKLWQGRGRTQPQMALERFCDLDAHVRFDARSVIVRLPLGRRHRELSESGLLAPVDNLPWLGGRRVEFGGG